MQANNAEGQKNDRLGKERRREREKGLIRANTAIYSNKKGGSCLNHKANRVSSGQRPGIV